jgi:hypothetical protein
VIDEDGKEWVEGVDGVGTQDASTIRLPIHVFDYLPHFISLDLS